MLPENLEQELKKGQLNNIYLLYGKEEFLLDTCVKKIKKLFGNLLLGINYIQIDDTNVSSLISEIQTPAFGYEKKLIVIKNSGLFKKSKVGAKKTNNTQESSAALYIEENISIIKDSVVLVFIEGEVDSNLLTKTIEKYGVVCNFERLKPDKIAKRLKAICDAYKVKIDDRTMTEFIEICGTNMQVLINEIRKLIEYAGENGTITKKEIELLSIKELESVIFDLTDSLGKKDIANALQILQELIDLDYNYKQGNIDINVGLEAILCTYCG